MEFTAENVRVIFFDSLAVEDEAARGIRVKGPLNEYSFSVVRLRSHLDTIRAFLGRVSTLFYEDRGGGHSCIQLGYKRDGAQWADWPDVERLLVLGLGLGLVEYCFKRRHWGMFPKGLPYVRIKGDVFRLWAIFRRSISVAPSGLGSEPPNLKDTFSLSFDSEVYPPPLSFDGNELVPRAKEEDWYKPALFRVSELSNEARHVAEAFYSSVVVDGFFDDSLPSWVLDAETTLQVY